MSEVTEEEVNQGLNRFWRGIAKYIVDSSGRGTHKTIAEAMDDAAENPKRTTLIAIHPHITLENFDAK